MGWAKTRYCACDMCRFHSTDEPGWDKCPVPVSSPEYSKGRWLWIKTYVSGDRAVDLEAADEAYLDHQRKSMVYEDVKQM